MLWIVILYCWVDATLQWQVDDVSKKGKQKLVLWFLKLQFFLDCSTIHNHDSGIWGGGGGGGGGGGVERGNCGGEGRNIRRSEELDRPMSEEVLKMKGEERDRGWGSNDFAKKKKKIGSN